MKSKVICHEMCPNMYKISAIHAMPCHIAEMLCPLDIGSAAREREREMYSNNWTIPSKWITLSAISPNIPITKIHYFIVIIFWKHLHCRLEWKEMWSFIVCWNLCAPNFNLRKRTATNKWLFSGFWKSSIGHNVTSSRKLGFD